MTQTKGKDAMRIFFFFLLLFIATFSEARTIAPNTVIDHDLRIDNDVIDMSHGSFIIRNNAVLTITHSQIQGVLSADNPTLFLVELGGLKMENNRVDVYASSILPHPDDQSLNYVVKLEQANVALLSNQFTLHDPFTAGLLITSSSIQTSNVLITSNTILNFHGALYLLNSNHFVIQDNVFQLNSYGNIVVIGHDGVIKNNDIYFAGRNHLGNAMDIINSVNVAIEHNTLFTPTCHGIYVYLSQDIAIKENKITGGITHAITILSQPESYMQSLFKANHNAINTSKNITIDHNYLSQNRYGIAASDVVGLTVQNNYVSQRFHNAIDRAFWTDNAVLLRRVSALTWVNNKYKEAFTQDNLGSNAKTDIVPYPATGGVRL